MICVATLPLTRMVLNENQAPLYGVGQLEQFGLATVELPPADHVPAKHREHVAPP